MQNYSGSISSNKKLVAFEIGGHNSIESVNREEYWKEMRDFIGVNIQTERTYPWKLLFILPFFGRCYHIYRYQIQE